MPSHASVSYHQTRLLCSRTKLYAHAEAPAACLRTASYRLRRSLSLMVVARPRLSSPRRDHCPLAIRTRLAGTCSQTESPGRSRPSADRCPRRLPHESPARSRRGPCVSRSHGAVAEQAGLGLAGDSRGRRTSATTLPCRFRMYPRPWSTSPTTSPERSTTWPRTQNKHKR